MEKGMKIVRSTGLIRKMSLSLVVCGSLYGAPNIPAGCTTPGSCAELTPALKSVTLKEEVKIADADASHTATLKAAATTTENVVITLPATNGQPNQILATDATGKLVWKSEPQNDRLLGMIGFMIPDSAKGIYEINGQTVTDAKLATYITNNPITGFSVSGDDVTLPDWRGRYLGASGAKNIDATPGATMASTNRRHTHPIWTDYKDSGASAQSGVIIGQANSNTKNRHRGTSATSYEGSSYARPETAGMPMVIIGESK